MAAAILGRKVGMTRVFDDKGVAHPCTVVQAGPCTVLQVKTEQTDGYSAVQIGFGQAKPHRSTKPEIGHARKAGAAPAVLVRESRQDDGDAAPDLGAQISVADFDGVTYVDVTGTTKGKGFTGVMKRWHFGGQPNSHGTERKHRSAGGIGSTGGSRQGARNIKLGRKMAGHLGDARRTVRNLRLLSVDAERNLMVIRGAIPGANGGLVMIRRSKTKKQG